MHLQHASKQILQALETANRILAMDPSCIEAHKMKTLLLMIGSSNFNESAITFKKLALELEKSENMNAKLFIKTAEFFGNLCCRNKNILKECLKLAEKGAQLEPGNADFMADMGHQYVLLGKYKEASKCYKNCTKLDDSSVVGLAGLTLCQILSGKKNEQVKQQVDFLKEVESDDPSAEVYLMCAKISVVPEDAAQALVQGTDKYTIVGIPVE